MKPDWDRLADEYVDSKTVVIGDVDCTAGGKPLCEKYGVKGYPTIKTFSSTDTEGTAYEGGRSYDDLKKHAETLGPSCSVDHKDLCSAEELTSLTGDANNELAADAASHTRGTVESGGEATPP